MSVGDELPLNISLSADVDDCGLQCIFIPRNGCVLLSPSCCVRGVLLWLYPMRLQSLCILTPCCANAVILTLFCASPPSVSGCNPSRAACRILCLLRSLCHLGVCGTTLGWAGNPTRGGREGKERGTAGDAAREGLKSGGSRAKIGRNWGGNSTKRRVYGKYCYFSE